MKERIPVLKPEMNLTFQHLYDDNFGVIARIQYNGFGDTLYMIMPSEKFIPEFNKSYKCTIRTTGGIFVYKNRRYRLAIATRTDGADMIDVIDYKYPNFFPTENETKSKKFKGNSLQDALQKAGVDKMNLKQKKNVDSKPFRVPPKPVKKGDRFIKY